MWIGDYAATTAVGADTVATPLGVVDAVFVAWATNVSSAAPSTLYELRASISTLTNSIVVESPSTVNNLSVRYTVFGR